MSANRPDSIVVEGINRMIRKALFDAKAAVETGHPPMFDQIPRGPLAAYRKARMDAGAVIMEIIRRYA